jgi:hypothetical protein
MVTDWFSGMYIGERSDSGSVKSFGSGNMSETPSPTPSHGSVGDNTTVASSPTTGGGSVVSRYFIIKAGSLKTIEASLSRGAWAFTSNTERKMTRVFRVRCIFYNKDLKPLFS